MSAAGGGSPALSEPEPPQELRRPRAASTIMARDEIRMGCKGRERRFIGFMGLEVPISVHGITRGIFFYYFTGGERLLMTILNKQSNSRSTRSAHSGTFVSLIAKVKMRFSGLDRSEGCERLTKDIYRGRRISKDRVPAVGPSFPVHMSLRNLAEVQKWVLLEVPYQ